MIEPDPAKDSPPRPSALSCHASLPQPAPAPPSSPLAVETPCRFHTRYWIWKVCTFFLTVLVFLIGFPTNPSRVWTVSVVNLAATTALYFVYRYGWTKVKWGKMR
jgi:hypothetical protein